MRHLIGDDVAIPEDAPDGAASERPMVLLDEHFWKGRRGIELGDLDLEIAKLLLDLQVHEVTPDELRDHAQAWENEPDAELVIQPFLRQMQVWGAGLPASVVKEASTHIEGMGLKLDGAKPDVRSTCWPGVRATGPRFEPRQGSLEERSRLLTDALALGGGYVELRGLGGKVFRKIGPRLIDLDRGLVGPMVALPFHFSRTRTVRAVSDV